MAASSEGNFEGDIESVDLAEFAKQQPWWRKLFGPECGLSAEKYSVATQLFIGGVTGWCTGFIFQKVGKLAATAVGGGFFLLQLANHSGYIKVDWQRVEKDMKKAKEQLKIRGVICEEESSSDWGIFRGLSAWHGILRKITSFSLFLVFSSQQPLYSIIGH
uniref:FUN14 domain containing 2 n=1 Tax=Papio anubis TaxID=9555 RepID=A0A8I5R0R6_PAPAN